ncbi:hypothetical protein QE363_002048 [Sphingomonas sp. SORGH_AS870]|uniref:hypothetical protein n=1 Tax=Sphingomonas sp. SORGH_AS_0870 TaxID=3041801 RepID=UPI0028632ECC|nr:hypothetical protein [Sphingomonas sp. SORGH_AS_0870]MDR6146255.1 hypothetical protein [Sphingomonas sp. SORGH_AS_0870]
MAKLFEPLDVGGLGAIESARNGNDFWAGLIMANWDNPTEVHAIRNDVTRRQAATLEPQSAALPLLPPRRLKLRSCRS